MVSPAAFEKVKLLVAEFERSGMGELHLQATGFELYLSQDISRRYLMLEGEMIFPGAGADGGVLTTPLAVI